MVISKREYEERYGEEVGTCNVHKITVVDSSCEQCYDEINWTCGECGEWRPDDDRVEGGMECGECFDVSI
jgi:predicted adenine nucleotide alpha hydrolase (AANH) superfamily ATPase|tara:strand:+ start:2080 stop:2289 length:210 start_codon:yes stop_codon:yes gene_type:complete